MYCPIHIRDVLLCDSSHSELIKKGISFFACLETPLQKSDPDVIKEAFECHQTRLRSSGYSSQIIRPAEEPFPKTLKGLHKKESRHIDVSGVVPQMLEIAFKKKGL